MPPHVSREALLRSAARAHVDLRHRRRPIAQRQIDERRRRFAERVVQRIADDAGDDDTAPAGLDAPADRRPRV